MVKHSLRIDFDDSTGAIAVAHRCTVDVASHAISHAEPVDLADLAAAAATLRGIVDANRAEMEKQATGMAINHVAAVNRTPQKGVKRLAAGGTLGAVGASETKKS